MGGKWGSAGASEAGGLLGTSEAFALLGSHVTNPLKEEAGTSLSRRGVSMAGWLGREAQEKDRNVAMEHSFHNTECSSLEACFITLTIDTGTG